MELSKNAIKEINENRLHVKHELFLTVNCIWLLFFISSSTLFDNIKISCLGKAKRNVCQCVSPPLHLHGLHHLPPVRGHGRQPRVHSVVSLIAWVASSVWSPSAWRRRSPRSKWVQSRSRIRHMATGAARAAAARSRVEQEAATEGGTTTIEAEAVPTGEQLNTTLPCNDFHECNIRPDAQSNA